MNIRFTQIEREYTIHPNLLNYIVIENQRTLYSVLIGLQRQMEGIEEAVAIIDNDTETLFTKTVDVISTPLDIVCSSPAIKKKLLLSISSDLELNECEEEVLKIYSNIEEILVRAASRTDFHIDYDIPSSLYDLLGRLNIRINIDRTSFLEALEQYIKVLHRLLEKRVFIIVNCCGYIDENDNKLLHKFARYEGVIILFIDCAQPQIEDWKNVIIIDKDLCELI